MTERTGGRKDGVLEVKERKKEEARKDRRVLRGLTAWHTTRRIPPSMSSPARSKAQLPPVCGWVYRATAGNAGPCGGCPPWWVSRVGSCWEDGRPLYCMSATAMMGPENRCRCTHRPAPRSGFDRSGVVPAQVAEGRPVDALSYLARLVHLSHALQRASPTSTLILHHGRENVDSSEPLRLELFGPRRSTVPPGPRPSYRCSMHRPDGVWPSLWWGITRSGDSSNIAGVHHRRRTYLQAW